VLICAAAVVLYVSAANSDCGGARRDQLLLDEPDWDYSLFLTRDLQQYLVDSEEFMREFYAAEAQDT
jgi:hypothetical protein